MQLRCPISRKYLNNGNVCFINQLFGENKNQLFYGPDGHRGIDIKTQGTFKFRRHNQKYVDGIMTGNWIKEERTEDEKQGFIPVLAAHQGYLTTNYFERDRKYGWGMFITTQDGNTEWRTMYWHIEQPHRSLGFWKAVKLMFKSEMVKEGSIIAIAGNTGQSTGAHLHFELQRREKHLGEWTEWERINPIPYLMDTDILYQRKDLIGNGVDKWFYRGKEITREQANKFISNFPTVCGTN